MITLAVPGAVTPGGRARVPLAPLLLSPVVPYPAGVLPPGSQITPPRDGPVVRGCSRWHARTWESAEYARRLLSIMRMAGRWELTPLAREIRRDPQAMRKALTGHAQATPALFEDWKNKLLDLAAKQAWDSDVTSALRGLVGGLPRQGAAPTRVTPWLFLHHGVVRQWPNVPVSLAAEQHHYVNPLVLADALTEVMWFRNCDCYCLAAEPRHGAGVARSTDQVSGRSRPLLARPDDGEDVDGLLAVPGSPQMLPTVFVADRLRGMLGPLRQSAPWLTLTDAG